MSDTKDPIGKWQMMHFCLIVTCVMACIGTGFIMALFPPNVLSVAGFVVFGLGGFLGLVCTLLNWFEPLFGLRTKAYARYERRRK